MKVRQLEHEADARLPRRQRELSSRFPQEVNQALEDQREFFCNGSDIRSMEARRASTRFTYRTESSSTTLGRRYVTTKSRIRWTTNTATSMNV